MMIRHCIVALLLTLMAISASADRTTPNEWLDAMSTVVKTMDFEGTVIRQGDQVWPI